MAWNAARGRPNCLRSVTYFTDWASRNSSPPAIWAERTSAPPAHVGCGPSRPRSGAAATTGAPDHVRVSRGSRARFVSASVLAPPAATSAIIGAPPASATTTTCSARAPHGTRVARPLRAPAAALPGQA